MVASAIADDFVLDPGRFDAIMDTGKEVPLLQVMDGEQNDDRASFDLETRRVGPPIPIDSSISLTISRTGHRIGVGRDQRRAPLRRRHR